MISDPITWIFVVGVLLLLGVATTVGQFLKGQPESGLNPAMVQTFNRRIRAWWLLCSLVAAALFLPRSVTVVLFGILAFWALREFITLTPTRLSDHRTLFWVFILFTPLQFVLVGLGKYDLYSTLIPVYGLLFVTARVAFSGDPKRFLERTAKIQAGLVLCIYCLSLAPALLYLDIYTTADIGKLRTAVPGTDPLVNSFGKNALLLFYFVFIIQMGDALQYLWGKILGHRVIAPAVSSTRTWEGMIAGSGSAALLGAALYWATPFNEWQAGCISLVIALSGFAGGMAMSAIKRDRGVQDYGTLVVGHGGVLDRIDSLCFAAPVFFLLTKTFFTLS